MERNLGLLQMILDSVSGLKRNTSASSRMEDQMSHLRSLLMEKEKEVKTKEESSERLQNEVHLLKEQLQLEKIGAESRELLAQDKEKLKKERNALEKKWKENQKEAISQQKKVNDLVKDLEVANSEKERLHQMVQLLVSGTVLKSEGGQGTSNSSDDSFEKLTRELQKLLQSEGGTSMNKNDNSQPSMNKYDKSQPPPHMVSPQAPWMQQQSKGFQHGFPLQPGPQQAPYPQQHGPFQGPFPPPHVPPQGPFPLFHGPPLLQAPFPQQGPVPSHGMPQVGPYPPSGTQFHATPPLMSNFQHPPHAFNNQTGTSGGLNNSRPNFKTNFKKRNDIKGKFQCDNKFQNTNKLEKGEKYEKEQENTMKAKPTLTDSEKFVYQDLWKKLDMMKSKINSNKPVSSKDVSGLLMEVNKSNMPNKTKFISQISQCFEKLEANQYRGNTNLKDNNVTETAEEAREDNSDEYDDCASQSSETRNCHSRGRRGQGINVFHENRGRGGRSFNPNYQRSRAGQEGTNEFQDTRPPSTGRRGNFRRDFQGNYRGTVQGNFRGNRGNFQGNFRGRPNDLSNQSRHGDNDSKRNYNIQSEPSTSEPSTQRDQNKYADENLMKKFIYPNTIPSMVEALRKYDVTLKVKGLILVGITNDEPVSEVPSNIIDIILFKEKNPDAVCVFK